MKFWVRIQVKIAMAIGKNTKCSHTKETGLILSSCRLRFLYSSDMDGWPLVKYEKLVCGFQKNIFHGL